MSNLCITFFYIQLLTVSIEIPFVVDFGSKVGSMIKALTFILVILVVVVYALFGDLSIFGSIDSFYDWLFNLISGNSKIRYTFIYFCNITIFINSVILSVISHILQALFERS